MIRLAPLITADVDTTTLPGGKASDAAQDFLALLSEALAGETTTDKRRAAGQRDSCRCATSGFTDPCG
ncbi:flagellar hook-length control protein [Escherichia coli ECA-0157]|nr:flagellar hook-length control protein [Escherichia coli ECA-0157]